MNELLATYSATLVEIELPTGRLTLPPVAAPALPDLPAELDGAFIITAWNPRSRRLELEENQARNAALAHQLQALNAEVWPAVGRDRLDRWREESYAVSGITLEQALELGRDFEQNAIFEVQPGGMRLHLCDERA